MTKLASFFKPRNGEKARRGKAHGNAQMKASASKRNIAK